MSAHGFVVALLIGATACGALAASPAAPTTESAAPKRALRQMQIHKVPALGLEVWVENQPEWETDLSTATGHPIFGAISPEGYHPPTVMTYASWPKERPSQESMQGVADSAIRRASQNFGLNIAQARGLVINPVTYGKLVGYESFFKGLNNKVPMDVVVFVGQEPGRFPVALTAYTLRGKMDNLNEQRRRAWGKLAYLPR